MTEGDKCSVLISSLQGSPQGRKPINSCASLILASVSGCLKTIKTLKSGWAFVSVTDETVLQRSNPVRSNDGVAECGSPGLSSSVYDHTEIRNNRGSKQPAVAQLVKISRARND